MKGRVTQELEVKVPASEAWKVYGSLLLAKILVEELPDQFSKFEVLQGDGHAGTIIQVFFAPGAAGPPWYKEKFTVVDDKRRVKEAEVVEGGMLDLGFTQYGSVLEVIEKKGTNEECIARGSIVYDAKDEAAAALVSAEGLLSTLQLAANYVTKNYNPCK